MQPAYAKQFRIIEHQRQGAGARVILGNWSAAQRAIEAGRRDVLVIPPGVNPWLFDFSMLRGCNALILVFQQINHRKFLAHLRRFRVESIALIDLTQSPADLTLAPAFDLEDAV